MALRISIPMPARLTHFVLCAATESSHGSQYWLADYTNRIQWMRSGNADYIALHIGAPLNDSTEMPVKHSRIGAARIAAALELMLQDARHAQTAGRIIAGTNDAPDADVCLQFAAFGEVIYG